MTSFPCIVPLHNVLVRCYFPGSTDCWPASYRAWLPFDASAHHHPRLQRKSGKLHSLLALLGREEVYRTHCDTSADTSENPWSSSCWYHRVANPFSRQQYRSSASGHPLIPDNLPSLDDLCDGSTTQLVYEPAVIVRCQNQQVSLHAWHESTDSAT